jgi:hypothetical protein
VLRTYPTRPDATCDAIGIDDPVTGRLEGDPADTAEPVWLRAADGRRLSVVWPEGFSVAFVPDVELRNEAGATVAGSGDTVVLGVGFASAEGTFDEPYLAEGIMLDGCYLPLGLSGVVATVEDGVRMRSDPNVREASIRYEPLLPLGTTLFVLTGPVTADGYEWYEVVPAGFEAIDHAGWVAAASREGVPWIEPASIDCPAEPTTISALNVITPGEALACFSDTEISLDALLVGCDCDVDGGRTPAWLDLSGQPLLLVEGPTVAPFGLDDGPALFLHPESEHPDPLPVGEVVRVTGVFDHPDAECTAIGFDGGDSRPDPSCRWSFVVTALSADD